jgi:hypothetical protein
MSNGLVDDAAAAPDRPGTDRGYAALMLTQIGANIANKPHRLSASVAFDLFKLDADFLPTNNTSPLFSMP